MHSSRTKGSRPHPTITRHTPQSIAHTTTTQTYTTSKRAVTAPLSHSTSLQRQFSSHSSHGSLLSINKQNPPRPRRSLLYVPGSSEKMLTKSLTSDADTICLDLEDGVDLSAKPQARRNIDTLLSTSTFRPHAEIVIRVNPVSTGDLYQEDMLWFGNLKQLPHAIAIPKVESLEEFQTVVQDLQSIEFKRSIPTPIQLFAMVESPAGILELEKVLKYNNDQYINRIAALIFGGDDYAASVGARRTESNHELSFARNMTLMIASRYHIPVLDIVCKEFKDLDRFIRESNESVELGFTGRQIIHPNQIAPANKIYSPTTELLAWANGVIKSYEQNKASGIGAFTYKGMMIDMPTIKRAFDIQSRGIACGIDITKL